LLGVIKSNEGIVLNARDPDLVARLGGLPVDAPREAFDHHLATLTAVVDAIKSEQDWEAKYRLLAALYDAASADWPTVHREANTTTDARHWIDGVASGLARYARTEGWV